MIYLKSQTLLRPLLLLIALTCAQVQAALIIFENRTDYPLIATIEYEALSSTLCKPHELVLKAGHRTSFEFPLKKALCSLGVIKFKTQDGKAYGELTRSKLPSEFPMRVVLTMNLNAHVYPE